MSSVRFFDPAKSYLAHKEEFDTAMQRVLSNGNLVGPTQPDILKFEKNLAQFTGKKYAVALNSGTDALYLSLVALGIKAGDEVVVPSHTFVATAQVVHQLGAIPVLVDIDEDWGQYITEKTRALIPAHISGDTLDMEAIVSARNKRMKELYTDGKGNWIDEKTCVIIEDACQALGNPNVGKSIIQCWSFYPAKILGAFGDAGGITTDNEQLSRDIKDLGNHWKSDYSRWGINSRMDNLQAAILNVKMKYLPLAIARREEIAEAYSTKMYPSSLPTKSPNRVWQDYIIGCGERRNGLFEFLKDRGIETMRNEYPMPVVKREKAFEYESSTLRLPCNENLTDEEVQYVIDCVNEFYA